MENAILVIVTALISGLLATPVTLWWQRRNNKYNHKLQIFETMMSYRFMIHAEESVKAINSVDVIFYDDENVRKALSAFLNETSKKPDFNPQIADKHLKLLEEMAKSLKLRNIHWDDIKQSYYPKGLSQKETDETVLRRLQIQNAIETAERNKVQQNTPRSTQIDEEDVMKILPELLKNPESYRLLMELGKKVEDK